MKVTGQSKDNFQREGQLEGMGAAILVNRKVSSVSVVKKVKREFRV